ncbi:hypothetical protein PTKIN_Ptkin02bG0253600 [Pterospermum kingtungense]
MENKASIFGNGEVKKGAPLRFSMKLPNGFDLEKKVRNWVETWQVFGVWEWFKKALVHFPGIYYLSNKIRTQTVVLKEGLVHFPGIFYVSNKIRTQTVVLKEAYRKDFLVEKHPLMGMRFRYIHRMNKAEKYRKTDGVLTFSRKGKVMASADKREVMK